MRGNDGEDLLVRQGKPERGHVARVLQIKVRVRLRARVTVRVRVNERLE